jgi:hypothetical protein
MPKAYFLAVDERNQVEIRQDANKDILWKCYDSDIGLCEVRCAIDRNHFHRLLRHLQSSGRGIIKHGCPDEHTAGESTRVVVKVEKRLVT